MFAKPQPYWMYGIHPVAAALANSDRTCLPLLTTHEAHRTLAATLLAKHPASDCARQRLAQANLVPRQSIDKLHKAETSHQSVSLKCRPLAVPSLADLLEILSCQPSAKVVVLDRVQDPHNIGAILRSARFFDAQALLLAKGHAPPENASVAKAACGALETLPILHANLAHALTVLGKKGWRRIAFEAQIEDAPPQHSLPTATHHALIFGAEGKGLRRLVRQHCDLVTRIEGGNKDAESLNVSNAVAVALAGLARELGKNR